MNLLNIILYHLTSNCVIGKHQFSARKKSVQISVIKTRLLILVNCDHRLDE